MGGLTSHRRSRPNSPTHRCLPSSLVSAAPLLRQQEAAGATSWWHTPLIPCPRASLWLSKLAHAPPPQVVELTRASLMLIRSWLGSIRRGVREINWGGDSCREANISRRTSWLCWSFGDGSWILFYTSSFARSGSKVVGFFSLLDSWHEGTRKQRARPVAELGFQSWYFHFHINKFQL